MFLSNLPDYVLLYIDSFVNKCSLCKTVKRIYKYRRVSLISESKSFILSDAWPAFVQSFHNISQIYVNIDSPNEQTLLYLCEFHVSNLKINYLNQPNFSNETMRKLATTVKHLIIHSGHLTDVSMFKNGSIDDLTLICCQVSTTFSGLESIHTIKLFNCYYSCFNDISMLGNVKNLTIKQCFIPCCKKREAKNLKEINQKKNNW